MNLEKFKSGESIRKPEFREKLNALVEAVNSLSVNVNQISQKSTTRSQRGIPVRLTAHGSTAGYYQFEEVWDIASGDANYTVKTGGLTHSDIGEARVRGGWADERVRYPVIGRVVLLYPGLTRDSSDQTVFEFEPPAPILFPVDMTQTGGSAGDNTGACSYTYTVDDVDGNQIETAVNPSTSPHTWARPDPGKMVAATNGLAYFGNSSNSPELRIVWCNEVIDTSVCS